MHNYHTTYQLASKELALPKFPESCTQVAQQQTVPFPYHIPSDSLNQQELKEIEDTCLATLENRLAWGAVQGQPIKVIIFEYMLSGSGAELSSRFLRCMASMLKRFHVSIIADEIMTGGRIEGTMLLTSMQEPCIQELVVHITMGKIFGCGVVLVKNQHRDEAMEGPGTTTIISFSEAYAKLQVLVKAYMCGVVEEKRNIVVSKLGLTGDEIWGNGLFIFMAKRRRQILKGLHNRVLPRLEASPRTRIMLGLEPTKWTKVEINLHLFDATRAWMQWNNPCGKDPAPFIPDVYTVELATHLNENRNKTTMTIIPTELAESIGADKENNKRLLERHVALKRKRRGNRHGRCRCNHMSLVRQSLRKASNESNGFITEAVKTKRRILVYNVDYDNLEQKETQS